MSKLIFGQDIRATRVTKPLPPGPITPPPGLSVKVDSQWHIDRNTLIATAELQSAATVPLQVILVGPNPFVVSAPVEQKIIQRLPTLGSNSKNVLETLEVPPNIRIHFLTRVPLASLFYEGTPTATFHWQFMVAGAPEKGVLTIKLPKRSSPASYFIDQKAVSEAEFQAFQAQLSDQQNSYSERTESGGRIVWTAKDKDGRRHYVVADSFDGWQFNEIYPVTDERTSNR